MSRWAVPLAAAAIAGISGCFTEYEVTAEKVEVDPGDVTECDFSQVEDTDFWRYDCNPVFAASGEDWVGSITGTAFHVSEVLGHPFYQVWYTAVEGDGNRPFGLGYAVSTNGTDWTSHPDNPLLSEPEDAGAWNADAFSQLAITYDPASGYYVGIYQGINESDTSGWGLGVVASSDGVQWFAEDESVFSLSEEVGEVKQWCWPLGLSLGEVAGYTGYVAGGASRFDNTCQAYRLDGSDFTHWTPDADEPVFPVGEDDEWDDQGFGSIAVAQLGERKLMFYTAFSDWVPHPTNAQIIIADQNFMGFAEVNRDGEWERQGGIVPIQNTEHGDVRGVAANTLGPRVHLWVTDAYCKVDGEVVIPESDDCEDWVSAVGYFLYEPGRAERLAEEEE
jgi:hypothetical protein